MFPKYFNVNNWKILDRKTIHAYNDAETPINVVKVEIGTVERYEVDFGYHYRAATFPIIRWITEKEYETYIRTEDVIVW